MDQDMRKSHEIYQQLGGLKQQLDFDYVYYTELNPDDPELAKAKLIRSIALMRILLNQLEEEINPHETRRIE